MFSVDQLSRLGSAQTKRVSVFFFLLKFKSGHSGKKTVAFAKMSRATIRIDTKYTLVAIYTKIFENGARFTADGSSHAVTA